MQKVNGNSLDTILSAHANALNQGSDSSDWLLTKYQHLYPELGSLLVIARQLKSVLVPQKIHRQTAAQIHAQLVGSPAAEKAPEASRRRWVWWGAAAAGSLIAGVAGFLVWRRGKVGQQTATAVLK